MNEETKKLLSALAQYAKANDDKNLDAFLVGYAGDDWEAAKKTAGQQVTATKKAVYAQKMFTTPDHVRLWDNLTEAQKDQARAKMPDYADPSKTVFSVDDDGNVLQWRGK